MTAHETDVVPAIHPLVAILGAEESDHTPQFAAAAVGPRGRSVMLASARALACTGADLLGEQGRCERAWVRQRRKAEAGQ
ncbi:hypothetical protein ACIP93_30840 [Streptomyces sp. NPDC088745]|uniref:hypothetical protein n=1 Tax=Streptomyces sp. NPDC088745 TaxID=3365884 RepID=UPI003812595B